MKKMMMLVAALFGAVQAWGAVNCSTWADVKSNLEAGNSVKLTANVTHSGTGKVVTVPESTITISGNVTLDLNGYTITCYRNNTGYRPFLISGSGAVLTITGSGTIQSYDRTTVEDGNFAYIQSSGKLVLSGGTIKGFKTSGKGGVVYVSGSTGAFTMNGGTISGCSADGGGAAVHSDGTFTMNGGTITSCTATGNGGAVYNNGTFTMNGGVLIGNKANGSSTSASAIVYNEGTATVNGGVSDNSHIGDFKAAGKDCIKVGSLYVVGTDVAADANGKLLTGTYTFCPTNAEYAAVGLALSSQSVLTESATTPKTWTVIQTSVSVEIPSVAHATVTNITVNGQPVTLAASVMVPSNSTIVVWYKADTDYVFTGDSTATLTNVTPDNKTIDASGVKVRTIILYYVSATGNDGNAGTVAAPLKTLAVAYNKIAAAGSIGTIALLSDITVPSGTSHAMDVADGKCIIITSAMSDGTLLDNAAGDYTGVWTIKRGSCTATIIDVTAASSLTLRHVVMSGEGKRFTASTKLEYPLIRATDGTASVITMDTNSILRDNRPTGSYSTRGGAVEIGTDVDSGTCPTAFHMISNAAMIGNEAARHGGAVTAYNCDFYMTDDARMEYNGINMVGGEYFGGGAILAYSARIHMSGNATIAHNYVQLNGCGDGGRMHNTLQIDPDRTIASLDVRDNVRVFDNYDNGHLTRNADGSYTLTGTIAANVFAGAGKMTIKGAMGDEAKIGVTVKNAAVNSVIANGTSAYTVTSEDANQFFDDSGTYTVIKHATNNQLVFGSAVTSVTLTLDSLTTNSLSGTFSADIGATANDITVFKDGVKMEGGYALTVSGTALAIAFDPALPKAVTIGVAVSKNGYKVNNGEVVYIELHQHCICGDGECTATGHVHADIEWQKWTNTTALPTSAGNWYLANDVTLSSTYQPATGVNLCLNGHVVKANNFTMPSYGSYQSVIRVSGSVAFAMTDCGTTVRYFTDTNGDHCYETYSTVKPSGAEGTDYLTITGGVLTGGKGSNTSHNYNSKDGGGVYVENNGLFTMYNGNIVGNLVDNQGAGVCVCRSNAKFVMNGGTIQGNSHDKWYGAGVYVYSSDNTSSMEMNGGVIAYNTKTATGWGSGGGIYAEGPVSIVDGYIHNNSLGGGSLPGVRAGLLTIGGKTVITGNCTTAQNVLIESGKTITISTTSPLTEGAKIGISTATAPTTTTSVAVTSNRGADYVYFTSDDPTYGIVNLGGVVKLVKGTEVGETAYAYVEDNVCTIYGTGVTSNDKPLDAQWASIKDVFISQGVTGLGTYFFYKFHNLTNVTIAASCTSLGEGALFRCLSLEQVTFEGTTPPELGENALPIRAAIKMVKGEPVVTMVPKVTVGGKEPTLKGSNDLSNWENVTSGNEKNYHFFKYVLGN